MPTPNRDELLDEHQPEAARARLAKPEPTFSGFASLTDWLGLEAQLETLDLGLLIDDFEGLPYRFDEVGDAGTVWWTKTRSFEDGDNQVVIRKHSDGRWTRRTVLPNGTYTQECSTTGSDWGSCS